ncbi:response regulator [Fulvivirga sp. RKSG066]|uniref:response regulator n=1 Tax=Fulvivirga aurantia TaxID=2529383 RepID=UPI0012BC7C69|nr:response regulator [Fulvivirga aurantia]MTI21848.1 response regulator [Fulvivirga aurantia]
MNKPNEHTLKLISVDDSKVISDHISFFLQKLPWVQWLGHAFTLEEARKLIEDKEPTLIILDIQMKGESGLDFLPEVQEKYKGVDVIMLSNHESKPYRERSKELGARFFLDKSSEFYNLPSILRIIYNNQKKALNKM